SSSRRSAGPTSASTPCSNPSPRPAAVGAPPGTTTCATCRPPSSSARGSRGSESSLRSGPRSARHALHEVPLSGVAKPAASGAPVRSGVARGPPGVEAAVGLLLAERALVQTDLQEHLQGL